MAAAVFKSRYPRGLAAPATDAVAVTPSDTVNLTYVTRGLYVGGAGTVTVVMASGDTVLFTGVGAGTILPIMVSRVNATGTGATSIVALW